MPLLAQVKLLRVLQEQHFERVGGNELVRTDVRMIAATNSDLEQLVTSGRFRQDLYFRLNVFAVRLPPLRDRGDDIDMLTDYYLARFAREFGRPALVVPSETRAALRAYRWPGNVRELQSVLKQAVLQSSGAVLLPEFISVGEPKSPPAVPTAPSGAAPERPALDWDRYWSAWMPNPTTCTPNASPSWSGNS